MNYSISYTIQSLPTWRHICITPTLYMRSFKRSKRSWFLWIKLVACSSLQTLLRGRKGPQDERIKCLRRFDRSSGMALRTPEMSLFALSLSSIFLWPHSQVAHSITHDREFPKLCFELLASSLCSIVYLSLLPSSTVLSRGS